MTFSPGNIVQLRSGGPHMTVEVVDGEVVYCLYLVTNGEILRSKVRAVALRQVVSCN